MANDDLFAAMKMFKDGVNELAIGNAIRGANDQVQQMKAQVTDEAEQRAALSGISNQLVTQMASMGAPVSQIATVAGAIGPRKFGSPAEAAMEGALSNSPSLLKAAETADTTAMAGDIKKQGIQNEWQANQNELNRINALAVAGKKADGKNAGKIPVGQLDHFTNGIAQQKGFDSLMLEADKNPHLIGPVAGRLPGRGDIYDKEYGAFQQKSKQLFNSYRSAVTGAGASVGEIKMLEESFPTGKESFNVYKEKVKAVLDMGKNLMGARLNVLEAGGYNTEKLRSLYEGSGTKTQEPSFVIKPIRDKATGKVRKAKVFPDGTADWVE
jgi:hypothetical protein